MRGRIKHGCICGYGGNADRKVVSISPATRCICGGSEFSCNHGISFDRDCSECLLEGYEVEENAAPPRLGMNGGW